MNDNRRDFDTENDATVALRLAGYKLERAGRYWTKEHCSKLQVVRDGGTGKYFVGPYK